jgi:hypothetical protein
MKQINSSLFKAISILFCMGVSTFLHGQDGTTWSRTFSEVEGLDVEQTPDGGYVLLSSPGYGYYDEDYRYIVLSKYDPYGNTLWNKILDSSGLEPAQGLVWGQSLGFSLEAEMVLPREGGYLIATAAAGEESGVILFRMDGNGDTLWTKTYWLGIEGCRHTYYMVETQEGDYILGGEFHSHIGEGAGAFLLKTDRNGDTLWTKVDSSFLYYDMRKTADGKIVLLGYNKHNEEPNNRYVAEIIAGPNGDTIVPKPLSIEIDYEGYFHFAVMEPTSDNGYIIVGIDSSYSWLIKADSNFDTIWTRNYSWRCNSDYFSCDVEQTADGGYIVLLEYSDYAKWELIKTDVSGNVVWAKTLSWEGIGWGSDVEQTADGGYIIMCSNIDESYIHPDTWLIKTDANGIVLNTSIDRAQNELALNIYPNPTNDLITIEISQPGQHFIEVTSLHGKLLYNSRMKGPSHQIDLSSFEKGLYFITIRSRDNVSTEKIIKQ